jgi:NADH-quinone oxidoreductase subunit A
MLEFVTPAARIVERFFACFVRPAHSLLRSAAGAQQRRKQGVLDSWLPFLIYGLFALAIPTSMIVFSYVFSTRPRTRTRARLIPFESGVSTGPPPQQRFTISFYLTAMLFIVFDIEIVFLYPLAVTLNALGWFGFTELVFFIVILALAYVYIWRKGALEWR